MRSTVAFTQGSLGEPCSKKVSVDSPMYREDPRDSDDAAVNAGSTGTVSVIEEDESEEESL